MIELPKRRGRPPKSTKETQTGQQRSAADAANPRVAWRLMKERLYAQPVTGCWLPEPLAATMEIGNNINVRVHRGDAAYQLGTGEVVKL